MFYFLFILSNKCCFSYAMQIKHEVKTVHNKLKKNKNKKSNLYIEATQGHLKMWPL